MEGRRSTTAMRILDFYDRHRSARARCSTPCSARALVLAREGGADGAHRRRPLSLRPGPLRRLGASGRPGAPAGITPASRFLDICAGLGGSRALSRLPGGCRVVGVDCIRAGGGHGAADAPGRFASRGGRRPRRRHRPAVRCARFDACLSQEALLHVRQGEGARRGAARAPSRRRLAFSDWIAHSGWATWSARGSRTGLGGGHVQSLDGYRALLGRAGFRGVEAEDLTDEWRAISESAWRCTAPCRADVRRLGEARTRVRRALRVLRRARRGRQARRRPLQRDAR